MTPLDPISTFALVATLEAVSNAGLLDAGVLKWRTAVIYGCGGGGNAVAEAGYRRAFSVPPNTPHPLTIPRSMVSAPTSQISMALGVHGPAFVISSACASSGHAIGEAMHMIRSGRVDVAITGGAEACLTAGAWAGWNALRVVATDTCRPFSKDRTGMVLGEGAATLVLEDWDHACSRGAKIYAELVGYGATADAASLTAPDADGIEAAVKLAHADAHLSTEEPVLISTHGTGTLLNDRTESEVLHRVYQNNLPACTIIATKSAHAHLIGGSGAIELLIGVLALDSRRAPPVLNYLGQDPGCDLPLALSLTPIDHTHLVSNSFAFGGLNAVLVARRV